MTGRLQGKRAVIVGAGQTPGETEGNGRAIARVFSREGAQLLLVDRDLASVKGTAELCGGSTTVLRTDVTDGDAGEAIAQAARKHLGGIDILVYNVGIGDRADGPVHKLREEAWHRILSVNLGAAQRIIGSCLPLLRDGGGSVVAISSLAALAPSQMIAYSVSKAGLNRMIQSMAYHEAAKGVRCNAITPGLMDTPMAIEGQSKRMGIAREDLRAQRTASVPMDRMGEAQDTAMAALYLASDEAKFVTGVILPVDGGASVKVAVS